MDGAFRTAAVKGQAKGRAEGERNEALEFALRMKADGMTAELIAKYTGLNVEEINSLKSSELFFDESFAQFKIIMYICI